MLVTDAFNTVYMHLKFYVPSVQLSLVLPCTWTVSGTSLRSYQIEKIWVGVTSDTQMTALTIWIYCVPTSGSITNHANTGWSSPSTSNSKDRQDYWIDLVIVMDRVNVTYDVRKSKSQMQRNMRMEDLRRIRWPLREGYPILTNVLDGEDGNEELWLPG